MNRAYDVILVGLGATGSAAAYALARRGVRVLGLDARRPPHSFGSHHGESRIIRKAYYEHPSYVPLLERAFAGWADLATRIGRRILLNTGGLMIGRPESELVSGVLASVREHRMPNEVLTSRTLVERFPQFRVDSETIGVWEADAGVLFPEECIRAFLDGAAAAGADLHYDEPVREWQTRPGRIEVRTDTGSYQAGALVLCAGTGLSALAQPTF